MSYKKKLKNTQAVSYNYIKHKNKFIGGECEKKNIFVITFPSKFEHIVIDNLLKNDFTKNHRWSKDSFYTEEINSHEKLHEFKQIESWINDNADPKKSAQGSRSYITLKNKSEEVVLHFNTEIGLEIQRTFCYSSTLLQEEDWLSNWDIDWYMHSFANNSFYENNDYFKRIPIKSVFQNKQLVIKEKSLSEDILDKLIARYLDAWKVAFVVTLLGIDAFNLSDPIACKYLIVDTAVSIWPVTYGDCVCHDFDNTYINPFLYQNLLEKNEITKVFDRYPYLLITHIVNTTDGQFRDPLKHWFAIAITKKQNYVLCSYSTYHYDFGNIFFHDSVQGTQRVQVDNANCGVYSILFVVLFSYYYHLNPDTINLNKIYDSIGTNAQVLCKGNNMPNIHGLKKVLF